MRLGIGNNLISGGGGLNPDKLALDLQFAADKTLTARKGPTPTFTRASSATFVGSNGLIQSAGNNVARFDHDPNTFNCKGLLIEESRTNLVLNSQAFNSWTALNLNTSGTPAWINAGEASPDGSQNAELLIGTTTTGNHQARQDVTVVSGVTYTLSCYFYGTSITSARHASIAAFGTPTGSVDFIARFDALAGTKVTPVGFSSSDIQDAQNGWWRCSAVFTAVASGSVSFRIGGASSTSVSYTGNNTDGIGAWGAQMEAGTFPTSYIPTTSASVVRSADVCSISGASFTSFYNPIEGTMVTAALANGFTTNNNAVSAIESGVSNVLRIINRVAQGNRLSAVVSGVTLTPASNYNSLNVVYKTAVAADASGADYVIDGTQVPDVFTGSVLTADNLKFSGIASSTSNNTISSFRYYKKRLPVAKLQTITA